MRVLSTLLCVSLFAYLFAFNEAFAAIVPALTPRERARSLVAKMSLAERLALVHGYKSPYVGAILAQPQHGIPELRLEDGPQGVGDGTHGVTCWPNALAAVSTFDRRLMHEFQRAMADEQKRKGTNVMLGPMTNIARVPVDGRAFESFGEDPFLSGEMVRQAVAGIQSENVMACVKHFCNNNQEYHRHTVSATVDDRTQHEIYYPAFKAGIEAGTGSVMCSYNLVNNTYACENSGLFRALKEEMGFEGFVMSDWGATHSTVASANAGLDMEMPSDEYFGRALAEAVAAKQVSETRIEDMAVRILTAMYAVGIMDTSQPTGNLSVPVDSKNHAQLARDLAAQSAVLLRNDGVLPLNPRRSLKIAVIGDAGDKAVIATGDGSGHVVCPYIVSPFEGIKFRVADATSVSYAPTLPLASAAKVASVADIAIIVVGTMSSEGYDRANLSLANNQDELIDAVTSVQKNTIVIVNNPAAVLMPWLAKTRAVVAAWYPGQEEGNAIAAVLFGDINPSARLPVTFPASETQNPLQTKIQYPGINDETQYTEKLLVGYRWYDATSAVPLFPFGHGLSYTSFSYSDLLIHGAMNPEGHVRVSCKITNTGNVSGAEVPQLYLGFPASAGEPPRLLRGFERTRVLHASEHQNVHFDVYRSPSVSVWNTTAGDWSAVHGQIDVFVGASSRDVRLQGSFLA